MNYALGPGKVFKIVLLGPTLVSSGVHCYLVGTGDYSIADEGGLIVTWFSTITFKVEDNGSD